jgi:hypothetical protein
LRSVDTDPVVLPEVLSKDAPLLTTSQGISLSRSFHNSSHGLQQRGNLPPGLNRLKLEMPQRAALHVGLSSAQKRDALLIQSTALGIGDGAARVLRLDPVIDECIEHELLTCFKPLVIHFLLPILGGPLGYWVRGLQWTALLYMNSSRKCAPPRLLSPKPSKGSHLLRLN